MTATLGAATTGRVTEGMRLEVRCHCPPPRRLPIFVQVPGLIELHNVVRQAAAGVEPSAVLLTYRCKACGTTVPLTLRDLYLTD